MKIACALALISLGFVQTTTSAEPVLARVVEVIGSVQGAGAIEAGATLPGTAGLTTGSASRITFRGFPESVVSFGADTQAAINHITIDHDGKDGGAMVRNASFKLDEGILFFAIDKVNWDKTKFEVVTPMGRVVARHPAAPKRATVGVAEVRHGKLHIATEAGQVSLEFPGNKSIAINSGSVLTSVGGSFQVVTLSTGEIATYQGSGDFSNSRIATTAELTDASKTFASSIALTETLAGMDAISAAVTKAIAENLIAVNQKLSELGLPPVDTALVGSLPGQNSSQSLPALPGAPGASGVNPANVSGNVNSPEH